MRRAYDPAVGVQEPSFPEVLKGILPFSYFLCYQYGVTSRPYALMVAAMLLVAINWKNRDEKPWREVLSMMLLCLTSSYGLVMAGMFAANWVVRFVRAGTLADT